MKKFGRETNGRKHELVSRSLELINTKNSDLKAMEAFLSRRCPSRNAYRVAFPHHIPSLDPVTGLPSIPGFDLPGLPPPPLEVNMPRLKATGSFKTSVYNQLHEHILSPELLCECVFHQESCDDHML